MRDERAMERAGKVRVRGQVGGDPFVSCTLRDQGRPMLVLYMSVCPSYKLELETRDYRLHTRARARD